MHRRNPTASRRKLLASLAALAVLPGIPFALAADQATFRYRGRPYAATGGNIVRRYEWSAKLPFDKTYAELTPTQLANIREQYDGLNPDEEPPYPKDGLQAIFRLVDEGVDKSTPRPESGPLMVVAKVDADGVVQSLKFFKAPVGLAMGAIGQALMKTPFKPATRGGQPVAMDFLLAVDLL